jgi:hypothetical protein
MAPPGRSSIGILEKRPHEVMSGLKDSIVHTEALKRNEDLGSYFEAVDAFSKQENVKIKLTQDFIKWHAENNIPMARRAGVSKEENDPNGKNPKGYLKRHALLSSLFLEKTGDRSFRVDFQSPFKGPFSGTNAGQLPEDFIGLADLLPPEARSVTVKKNGEEAIVAVRARNPSTGRIGFYAMEYFQKGEYKYVPIYTGDIITDITHTVSYEPNGKEYANAEHDAIFEDNAGNAFEEVELQPHRTYAQEVAAVTERRQEGRAKVTKDAAKRISYIQREIAPDQIGLLPRDRRTVEIGGVKIDTVGKAFCMNLFGTSEAATNKWMTSLNPATGKPLTLCGYKVGRVNMALIPYIIELDRRLEERGIHFNFNHISSVNWRPPRGKKGLSYHSWGFALDMNPGENPVQYLSKGQKMKCSFPPEMIQIMKDVGFMDWGGDWRTPSSKRPGRFYCDPMHWRFIGNAASIKTQRAVLRHPSSIAAAKAVNRKVNTFDEGTRRKWEQAREDVLPIAQVHPQMARRAGIRAAQSTPRTTVSTLEEDEPTYIDRKMNADILRNAERYRVVIEEAAHANNIPPELLMAVAQQESGFRTNLLSSAGAGGMFQFMPPTARGFGMKVPEGAEKAYVLKTNSRGKKYKKYHWLTGDSEEDQRLNPELSIRKAARMFSGLLGSIRNGKRVPENQWKRTIPEALACYNWGSGNVNAFKAGKKGMPIETRNYISKNTKKGAYGKYLSLIAARKAGEEDILA